MSDTNLDKKLAPSTTEGSSGINSETSSAVIAGAYERPKLGALRKNFMLFLFCFAEFMDAFIASALFPAIPILEDTLKVNQDEIAWAFAAYSATFSAFLLISGRFSDVYSARLSFIGGAVIIGAFSLGGGFTTDAKVFFVLRALAGIGAALTVPSGLSLIIEWFPEPEEQNRGIAMFGGCGGLGNVFGVILGGIFVQWATWKWVLWFTAILGLGIAGLSFLVVPPSAPRRHKPSWQRLDLIGVMAFTSATILFVYAVTSGNVNGWKSANFLAPLLISLAMYAGFLVYEAKIDPEMAALPPRVWKYSNVPILVGIGLMPFFWWSSLYVELMPRFQEVYHWNVILSCVRFLPAGVGSIVIAVITPNLLKIQSPKYFILLGLVLAFISTIIIPFAPKSTDYWSHLFPSFLIGTCGTMMIYTCSNIAIFMNTPPEIAGIVGGIYNAALQLGIAVGVAIFGSINSSVADKRAHSGKLTPDDFHGTAAVFWFVLAALVAWFVAVLLFYRVEPHWRKGAAAATTAAAGDSEKQ